jgi:LmbE family N-acetylglucosaminyl deacetylase
MITPASTTGKEGMHWIYLSPHLDDAALSCGGLIWEQSQAGVPVDIWSICAGDPPAGPLSPFAEQLHARWETGRQAGAARRREDALACRRLNAIYKHFSLPDCIYRQDREQSIYLYASEETIFGSVHALENDLVAQLSNEITQYLPGAANLVIPLALGGHVDHRLVRLAAEQIHEPGVQHWYYADYPYALHSQGELGKLSQSGWRSVTQTISPAGLEAWKDSIADHKSQISTFWPDLAAMRDAIQAYYQQNGGICLWRFGD